MIVAWMVYWTLVTALLGFTGWVLERAFRLYGQPTRRIWVAMIVTSLIVAELSLAQPELLRSLRRTDDAGRTVPPSIAPILAGRQTSVVALDRPLLVAWMLGSAAAFSFMAVSFVRIRRARRRWQPGVVDGEPVLLSEDEGPAVLGVREGTIMIPRWVLEMNDDCRRLLLEHEREHVAAGDHRLVLLAALAIVLMPWNVALWWQVIRLQLAVEVDCDGRVLARHRNTVRVYGTLLLEVGQLVSGGTGHTLTMFSKFDSRLEHRIRAMTARTPRGRFGRATILAVIGAAFATGACAFPDPPAVGCFLDSLRIARQVTGSASGSAGRAGPWMRLHLA